MRNRLVLLILVPIVVACGCDQRLADMAQEASNRQAEQNTRMATLQENVTKLQHDVQQSQAEVGRQRDLLENERRDIAVQRHRDPIIAATIMDIGLVLACLLPLLLAGYVVHCLRDHGQSDSLVAEVLVQEIVAEKPLLLPPARSVAAIPLQAEPPTDDATASEEPNVSRKSRGGT